MSKPFHPLRDWLGIESPPDQPNYYQLLSVDPQLADPEQIKIAADRALAQVRSHRPGDHAQQWAQLLDELTVAKQCLTDPDQRAQYDAALAAGTMAAAPTESSTVDRPANPTSNPSVDSNFLPPTSDNNVTEPDCRSEKTEPDSLQTVQSPTASPTPTSVPGSATYSPSVQPAPSPPPLDTAPQNIPTPPIASAANHVSTPGAVVPSHLQATGLATVDPMQPYSSEAVPVTMPVASVQPVANYAGNSAPGEAPATSSMPTPDVAPVIADDSQAGTKIAVKRARQDFDRRIFVVAGLLLIGLSGTVVALVFSGQFGSMFSLAEFNQSQESSNGDEDQSSQTGSLTGKSKGEKQPSNRPGKTNGPSDTTKPEKPKPEKPKPEPEKPKPEPEKPKPEPEKPKPEKPKPEPEKPKPAASLQPAELASLKAGLKTARQALYDRDFNRSTSELKKVEPLARFPEQLAAVERLEQLRFYAKAFDEQLRKAIQGLAAGSEIKISESTILAVVEVGEGSITVRIAGSNRNYLIEELKPGIAVAIIKQSYDLNDPNISAILGAYVGTLKSADEEDLAKANQYWQIAINKGIKLENLIRILKDDYEQLKADQ